MKTPPACAECGGPSELGIMTLGSRVSHYCIACTAALAVVLGEPELAAIAQHAAEARKAALS